MALRDAVKEAHPEPEQGGGELAYTAPPADHDPDAPHRVEVKFGKFSRMIGERPPTVLRDLFQLKFTTPAVPIGEVEPAVDMVRNNFRGAAMSHGALTGASHMTIAAAVNELGAMSNSGEGGEARWRNDIPKRAWGPFWEKVRAQRAAHPGGLGSMPSTS
jgi:glutamate synthase domain-containing protein 2